MTENKFKGILAALITPFDAQGEVNYAETRHLVRHLIQKGIDGFYVCGSTGEAFLLSEDERKRILDCVLEENNGEKLVLAHVGSISTREAQRLAVHASAAGADAVSAISPFYYKFKQEEIVGYYLDISNAVPAPMFIYNFPNQSGFSLTPDLLDRICRGGNIAGVKFTSNNFFDLDSMKSRNPELTIWNGFDEMLLSGLAAGADGAIGSTYNVNSPIALHVYHSFLEGDIAGAQQWQHQINAMLTIHKKHGNLKMLRRVLELEGVHVGQSRPPFLPLGPEADEDAQYVLEHYASVR